MPLETAAKVNIARNNRTNKSGNVVPLKSNESPYKREKFCLGADVHFETAEQFAGKLSVEKVIGMFNSKDTSIAETEGKSLKVLFTVPVTKEIKFMGFLTACDYSQTLSLEDVPRIKEHINTITKATTIDEIVNMF